MVSLTPGLYGVFVWPALVQALVVLGAAALVARGPAWASLLGGVLAVALLVAALADPGVRHRLGHPAEARLAFAAVVIALLGAGLAGAGGITGGLHARRR